MALFIDGAWAASVPAFVLSEQTAENNMAVYTQYLKDPDGLLLIDDVTGVYQRRFRSYTPKNRAANFGIDRSIFWLRFSIENPDDENRRATMRLINPLLEQAAFYKQTEGGRRYIRQQLDDSLPLVHLDIPAGQKQTFYYRVQTGYTASFPLYLDAGPGFYEYIFGAAVHRGIIVGLMVGMLIYNLLLFFFTRDVLYCYYSLTATFVLLTFVSGLNFLYVLPNLDQDINKKIFDLSPLFIVACYSQFTRHFLETRRLYPRNDKFLLFVIFYSLFFVAMEAQNFSRSHFTFFYLPLVTVMALSTLYIAFDRFRQGFSPAGYYLVGMLIAAFGGVWGGVANMGIYSSLDDMMLMGEIVGVVHWMLLSLGIAARINLLDAEKNSVERSALKEQLESKAKSDFVSHMSQEIKTPMDRVLGMSAHLKKSRLDVEQAHYVDIIRSSGQSLLSVINDIVDYSRLEDGTLAIEPQSFMLKDLVKESIDLFELTAADKKLQFVCDMPLQIDYPLQGDAARIRQVLINLLGNAFKFTFEGYVRVIVSSEIMVGGGSYIRFEIADSGIGIDKNVQNSLFQAYQQADISTARRFGGSGLGLNISQRLCEIMGGEIGFSSTVNVGSIFWFMIPLQAVGKTNVEMYSSEANPGRLLSQAQVIYCYKDRFYAKTFARQLESVGGGCTLIDSPAALAEWMEGRKLLNTVCMLDGAFSSGEIDAYIASAPLLPKQCWMGLSGFYANEEKDRLSSAGIACLITRPAFTVLLFEQIETRLGK